MHVITWKDRLKKRTWWVFLTSCKEAVWEIWLGIKRFAMHSNVSDCFLGSYDNYHVYLKTQGRYLWSHCLSNNDDSLRFCQICTLFCHAKNEKTQELPRYHATYWKGGHFNCYGNDSLFDHKKSHRKME